MKLITTKMSKNSTYILGAFLMLGAALLCQDYGPIAALLAYFSGILVSYSVYNKK